MKFDDVLKQIGEFGPYQRRVYCLAAAPAILLAFETLSVIFIFNIPDHRCAVPGLLGDTYRIVNDSHAAIVNLSIPFHDGQWDKCHVFTDVAASNLSHTNGDVGGNSSQSACDKWVFDHSTFDSTIATDFDVVCDRSMLRARSNMISELGTLVGTLVCGFIADRFGRKITFYVAGLALAGGGFGIAFATNLLTLNVCRFILGIARMATWSNSFVIGMEIVGPSKRTFAGMAIEFVWCAGEALLLLMAYFVRNWRYLEIALSVPSIGLFFYWWLMPESPRWLASRGRDGEAVRILEKIAASNRTVLPKVEDAKQLLEGEHSIGFLNIFRSRELVLRMLIVFSNMFIIVMVYYGLTLNITNLSGNIYSNFAVNIAFEVLAYIAPYLLLDRVGRKPVYCASILLAGAACVMSVLPVLLAAPLWVVSGLSMLGRFFVSVAFAVIYVYGAELFPTVIRTSTMGVGIAFARVGNMIAPYLADVGVLVGGELQLALPLLLMGIPAVLVGLLSLWLPETLGVKMPETMMDVGKRNMNRKRRCCLARNDDDDDDEESSVNM